jgi:ankyrin repeat protein
MNRLQESSKYGRIKETRILLKAGFDPNVKSNYGYTPLMSAVINGHHKIVVLLLKYGADINIGTKKLNHTGIFNSKLCYDNFTPIMFCLNLYSNSNNRIHIFKTLTKYGALNNIKIPNSVCVSIKGYDLMDKVNVLLLFIVSKKIPYDIIRESSFFYK